MFKASDAHMHAAHTSLKSRQESVPDQRGRVGECSEASLKAKQLMVVGNRANSLHTDHLSQQLVDWLTDLRLVVLTHTHTHLIPFGLQFPVLAL